MAPERTVTEYRVSGNGGFYSANAPDRASAERYARFLTAHVLCVGGPFVVQQRRVTYLSDWVDVPAENGDDDER